MNPKSFLVIACSLLAGVFAIQLVDQNRSNGFQSHDGASVAYVPVYVQSKAAKTDSRDDRNQYVPFSQMFPPSSSWSKGVQFVSDTGGIPLTHLDPIPESENGPLTVSDLECINDSIDKLSQRLDALTASANNLPELGSECQCNCPTAEEIAEAVEARLKPYFPARVPSSMVATSPGSIVATVAEDIVLRPGEVFMGFNGPAVTQTYSQNQRSSAGPVMKTCQRIWNATTRRYETRCN